MSMADVERLIAERRDRLIVGHEFMRRLEGDADLEALRRLLPRLAFFTFAFQDMLKIACECASDPFLAPILRSLRDGDRGHDGWYVLDLSDLGIALSAHQLFESECEVGRRVAYTLIGLIQQGSSDHVRLALFLTLESAAREFFERVPGFAARAGLSRELRYFGNMHLIAEGAHDVFEAATQEILNTIMLPADQRANVVATIDTTFAQMLTLADDLAAALFDGNANS